MTAGEVIIVALSSSVLTGIISNISNRRAIRASAKKTDAESSDLAMQSEIRISEYYKKEYQELIRLYEELEKSHAEEVKQRIDCRKDIATLQQNYNELVKQFNLIKIQLSSK